MSGAFASMTAPVLCGCDASGRGVCAINKTVGVPFGRLFSLIPHMEHRGLAIGATILRQRIGFRRVGQRVVRLCTATASRLGILGLHTRTLRLTGVRCSVTRGGFIGGAVGAKSLSIRGRERSATLRTFRGDQFRMAGDLVVLRMIAHAPVLGGWGLYPVSCMLCLLHTLCQMG